MLALYRPYHYSDSKLRYSLNRQAGNVHHKSSYITNNKIQTYSQLKTHLTIPSSKEYGRVLLFRFSQYKFLTLRANLLCYKLQTKLTTWCQTAFLSLSINLFLSTSSFFSRRGIGASSCTLLCADSTCYTAVGPSRPLSAFTAICRMLMKALV